MNPEHHPKLSPVRAFQALHGSYSEEDTSLSEYHDYEPSLEFDDSELIQAPGLAPLPPELLNLHDEFMQRSASDGTIEENFEEELAKVPKCYAEFHRKPAVASEKMQKEQANKAIKYGILHYRYISMNNPEQIDYGGLPVWYNVMLDAVQIGNLGMISMSSVDEECFMDLFNTGLLDVVGDDQLGRRIIVISACRLPPSTDLHPDKFLRFLMFTLDKYVEQDYTVVYFHCGLTSKNKPPLSWLWKAYKAFDRKYKKNLKALYLVHPTNLIRIVWQMLRPAISVKFGRKVMYVNYLHELQEHLSLDQLSIPEAVLEHDKQLLVKNPRAADMALRASRKAEAPVVAPVYSPHQRPRLANPPPTYQFGVSLEFIRLNNPGMVDSIPPIVRYCVNYLLRPESLETEGIFRRSTSVNTLNRMKDECNRGKKVDFQGDPHSAAVLLKTFLRDLDDPVLTHRLYEEIIQFPTWTMAQKPRLVKILLLEKLPLDNYKLLKYIVKFLGRVADMSCLNKMTINNLAVVFGPNFLWPPHGQLSLHCIHPVNLFTDFILENQDEIFII